MTQLPPYAFDLLKSLVRIKGLPNLYIFRGRSPNQKTHIIVQDLISLKRNNFDARLMQPWSEIFFSSFSEMPLIYIIQNLYEKPDLAEKLFNKTISISDFSTLLGEDFNPDFTTSKFVAQLFKYYANFLKVFIHPNYATTKLQFSESKAK